MVAAYEAGAPERFWRDLTPLGGLLLDDIHSIEGREVTQERLLDGLTDWAQARRLLVITSDRAPSDTPALARRLQERVRGSVAARIERPEPALRLAILRQKAQALGLVLEPQLAARVASAFGDNVRRLEGALNRLLAHARLSGRQIDAELAAEVLAELRPRPPSVLTVDDVIASTPRPGGCEGASAAPISCCRAASPCMSRASCSAGRSPSWAWPSDAITRPCCRPGGW